ncbi:FecR domain-containing protein [Chitinophaga sp. MM2321]|uniref:FecR family protein n=1 Tax=Chitinophaga sp. MM2321 TaxID=3137178 RepID=UPI0032D5940A
MEKQAFLHLIDKYLAGEASAAEQQLLENYLASFQQEEGLDESDQAGRLQLILEKVMAGEEKVMSAAPVRGRIVMMKMLRYAAMVIVLAGAVLWYFTTREHKPAVVVAGQTLIQPGSDGATLTLEDGSTVQLDSAVNKGLQVIQAGSNVVAKNGMLLYEHHDKITETRISFNTLRTTKGKQFKLQLPDGSVVKLNAASSIRFPTSFEANERSVTVEGEAYFEVAPDASKPFIVVTRNHHEIKVLGTEFNLNAYDDEPFVRTTLVKGKVLVYNNTPGSAAPVVLLPGQETRATDGKIVIYEAGEMNEATAWLNNKFSFSKADIKTVMRQVARWYDIEVAYDGDVAATFSGSFYRADNIDDLLKIIAYSSNVAFKWEGRTLHIMPLTK